MPKIPAMLHKIVHSAAVVDNAILKTRSGNGGKQTNDGLRYRDTIQRTRLQVDKRPWKFEGVEFALKNVLSVAVFILDVNIAQCRECARRPQMQTGQHPTRNPGHIKMQATMSDAVISISLQASRAPRSLFTWKAARQGPEEKGSEDHVKKKIGRKRLHAS